jgi:hypothetical protein
LKRTCAATIQGRAREIQPCAIAARALPMPILNFANG